MSGLLPGLLVLAIGGSIAPPLLLFTILFLGSRQPFPTPVRWRSSGASWEHETERGR
jgi:hypothetical protein